MQASIIRRSPQAKLQAMAAGMAITIARSNQDPLYRKYRFMRRKYKKLQGVIEKRYGRQAMLKARQVAAKSGLLSQMR